MGIFYNQPKGKKEDLKMTRKQVIKRAEQLDDMFNKFKAKCKELVETINEEGYDYNAKFYVLRSTLENIVDFDLEDSILDAKEEL